MQDSRIRTDTAGDGLPAHFRRVVSFHPRGGRLNAVQRKAFETHADRWYLEAAELDGPVDGAGAVRPAGRAGAGDRLRDG